MKKAFLISIFMLGAVAAQARMPQADDVKVSDISAVRDGSRLNIGLRFDVADMPAGQNIETRLIPVLVNGSDSARLESVTIAGRNRYMQAKRTGSFDILGNKYLRAGKVSSFGYASSVAYQPWMDTATISLIVENLGCCESRKNVADLGLALLNMGPRAFDVAAAGLNYITPVEEKTKMRFAKGEAYIDFVVNTTNIRPTYRDNARELAKISATIDSIKADPDTKITTLTITGYASPEGSYANNERLAKGRTEALAEYVRKLYTFPKGLMKTAWVAEDWQGLRAYVNRSSLPGKAGILKIIDSSLAPDAKDAKIRSEYPKDYEFLLKNCYPALRHSDYNVAYEVRKYTDPAEIAKVFKQNPSKLSLRELFIYAETLKPDSPEYSAVFDTAARMHPDNTTANLNAANCALMRGDTKAAAAYLAKAGDTPQAVYARGVLAARQGDLKAAADLFAKAKKAGIDTARAEAQLASLAAPAVTPL